MCMFVCKLGSYRTFFFSTICFGMNEMFKIHQWNYLVSGFRYVCDVLMKKKMN